MINFIGYLSADTFLKTHYFRKPQASVQTHPPLPPPAKAWWVAGQAMHSECWPEALDCAVRRFPLVDRAIKRIMWREDSESHIYLI